MQVSKGQFAKLEVAFYAEIWLDLTKNNLEGNELTWQTIRRSYGHHSCKDLERLIRYAVCDEIAKIVRK
jgi:hypothetical protein